MHFNKVYSTAALRPTSSLCLGQHTQRSRFPAYIKPISQAYRLASSNPPSLIMTTGACNLKQKLSYIPVARAD